MLADATVQGLAPHAWAARAVALYRRLEADALVVETNQGGELVAAVLREVDPGVPVTEVNARAASIMRAEPVSVLYAKAACTMSAPSRSWRTRCAISAPAAFPPAAPPTASTPSSGRSTR